MSNQLHQEYVSLGLGCGAALSRRSSSKTRGHSWLLSTVVSVLLVLLLQPACLAQLSGATEVDVGVSGIAGSFSYNNIPTPPQYSVTGAGLFSNVDVCGFANITASSNVELEAQVLSVSGTDTGSLAGLMMRESYNFGGVEATMAVAESGVVQFHYRPTIGYSDTQVTGPTVSLPVFLRLVKSGSTITGYYSTDDESWNSVGSVTATLPNIFYAGLASTSNSSSALSTAVFDHVTLMTSVPQNKLESSALVARRCRRHIFEWLSQRLGRSVRQW